MAPYSAIVGDKVISHKVQIALFAVRIRARLTIVTHHPPMYLAVEVPSALTRGKYTRLTALASTWRRVLAHRSPALLLFMTPVCSSESYPLVLHTPPDECNNLTWLLLEETEGVVTAAPWRPPTSKTSGVVRRVPEGNVMWYQALCGDRDAMGEMERRCANPRWKGLASWIAFVHQWSATPACRVSLGLDARLSCIEGIWTIQLPNGTSVELGSDTEALLPDDDTWLECIYRAVEARAPETQPWLRQTYLHIR